MMKFFKLEIKGISKLEFLNGTARKGFLNYSQNIDQLSL